MHEIAERAAATAGVLHRTGLLRGDSPLAVARGPRQTRRWGAGLAGAIASHGARHPDRVALVDELGPETYGELDERTDRLANALRADGLRPGERVGLLCRDHRFFVEGAVAVNKAGADLVLLNTSFSGPQLRDVCEAEGIRVVIHDDEFTPLAGDMDARRVLAWHEPGA